MTRRRLIAAILSAVGLGTAKASSGKGTLFNKGLQGVIDRLVHKNRALLDALDEVEVVPPSGGRHWHLNYHRRIGRYSMGHSFEQAKFVHAYVERLLDEGRWAEAEHLINKGPARL